jgi:endonuclease/exonuclease/phosphatase family metal-dependent hydrolase
MPTVLCGDFNCGVRELTPLLGRFHMAENPPRTYPSLSPFTTYDHILWTSDVRLRRIEARASLASDHVPLVAELEITT